jgi:hypothetical protein
MIRRRRRRRDSVSPMHLRFRYERITPAYFATHANVAFRTRGKHALPVYSEVQEDGAVPEYQVDEENLRNDGSVMTPDDNRLADYFDASDMRDATRQTSLPITIAERSVSSATASRAAESSSRVAPNTNGKTAEEIASEYQARMSQPGYRQKISKAAHSSMMSSHVGNFGGFGGNLSTGF